MVQCWAPSAGSDLISLSAHIATIMQWQRPWCLVPFSSRFKVVPQSWLVPKSKVNLPIISNLYRPSCVSPHSRAETAGTVGHLDSESGGGIYVHHPPPTRHHSNTHRRKRFQLNYQIQLLPSYYLVLGTQICHNLFWVSLCYLSMNLKKSRTSRWKVNTMLLVDLMVTLESALGHSPVHCTALLAACTHGCWII